MQNTSVEMARITLKTGCTEADLVEASETFQKEFLDGQPGFISRELLREGPGAYLDLVRWTDRAAADAVMQKAESSPACAAYFGVMDFDPETSNAGVAHFNPVAGYGKA